MLAKLLVRLIKQNQITMSDIRNADENTFSSNNKPITTGDVQSHQKEKTFDILVDNVPYNIKVIPFNFNEDVRYYASINGGPQHVLAWDSEMTMFTAIDDDSATIPDGVMIELNNKLL